MSFDQAIGSTEPMEEEKTEETAPKPRRVRWEDSDEEAEEVVQQAAVADDAVDDHQAEAQDEEDAPLVEAPTQSSEAPKEADSDKKEKKEKKEKKKDKKEKKESATEADDAADVSMMDVADVDVEVDPSTLSPIACPLASEALTKKVYKTIRKASKSRGHVKRGVKEVVKGLRKGEKGLVILAGDISPIDILSHIPVLCEDSGCPYVYVASKDQLGNASSTKRPTSCVMIVPGGGKKAVEKGETKVKEDYQEDYSFLHKEASRLVEQVLMS